MTLDEISALSVGDLAEPDCHLWLWTTNTHLEDSFGVMRAWGFQYLTTVTWVKPHGAGAYFATTTQHCLFGYRERCRFERRRWAPTHFHANATRHSVKPDAFLDLVESISEEPRLELFARRQRLGWDTWGNEALEHVEINQEIGPSGAAQRRHGPSAPGVGGGSLADASGALALKGEARTPLGVPECAPGDGKGGNQR